MSSFIAQLTQLAYLLRLSLGEPAPVEVPTDCEMSVVECSTDTHYHRQRPTRMILGTGYPSAVPFE